MRSLTSVPTARQRSARARAVAVFAGLVLAAGSSARAQTPAVSLPDGSAVIDGGYTLGFEFTVSAPTTVTALGIFDAGQNSLIGTVGVGLYQSDNQALLASAGITSADPLFGTTFYRYAGITSLVLNPGTSYIIAGVTTNDNPFPSGPPVIATVTPGINFITDRFERISGTSLTFPTRTDSNEGVSPTYPMANFLIGSAAPSTAAPEPGSLALLLPVMGTVGVAGMVIRRRKTSKTSKTSK